MNYTIEQFMDTEGISSISVSHDDQYILYASDRTGVNNVYVTGINGNEFKQLTYSETDSIYPVSFFPKDNRFLYQSDHSGDELTHLYVYEEDGETKELTTGENEKAMFLGWHHDENSFFYQSNKRDARFMDLYEMDIETLTARLIFQNDQAYQTKAVSPDGSYIALHQAVTANDSHMYIYSLENGLFHLSPHEGDVQFIPLTFDEQSAYIYYLTDYNSEFLHLKRMHIRTNTVEIVAKENWDIVMAHFSYYYRYLVYAINENGKIKMKMLEISSNRYIDMSDLPDGQISDIAILRNEKQLTFLLERSNSPANLYTYDFIKKKLNCLTNTLNPEISPYDLIEAKTIYYESFDGLFIPAIYYEPSAADREKVPAIVWVHGGPGGQSMVDYNPIYQYLVNHGYAVLAVNNRGSSGYGKTFFKAADLKHGEADLADCVEAKTYLASTGRINDNQIGIAGESYGGYITLAAMAFQSDAFEVGLDIFGVSNWERTLKEIPAWWEGVRDVLYKKIGNPYIDTTYIRSISPLFHSDNIQKPLFVLQGKNDPRVLKAESDDIVTSVRQNNVPVEYVVFDDEGHGLSKRKNVVKGIGDMKKFLDRYLKSNS